MLEFFRGVFNRPASARPALPRSLVKTAIERAVDGTDPRGRTPGPLVTPSAIEYTGPITINGPTRLFVRVYNPAAPLPPVGSGFSAPTILVYSL